LGLCFFEKLKRYFLIKIKENTHIVSMFLWLCILSCEALFFPAPSSKTPGWHPIRFVKDYKHKPQRIQFIDANYVLWKGDEQYHLRPDVCPHQGALLSYGTIVDNCIKCPYHGLNVGPYENAHNDCMENYGMCMVKHNIIWWSPNELTDTITDCDELSQPRCELELNVQGSFSDCYKNSMDFHHAAFVHKHTFGNYAGEPSSIKEVWNKDGHMEGHFKYGSNEFYGKYTGGETENIHVYCKPSTTYNMVKGNNKTMVIFLAMRALSSTETKWFLCASSNFVPNNLLGHFVLDLMVKRVAIYEDGRQLSKMASQSEKDIHAYKFKLPLDSIYDEWLKSL
jgi:hypothetical protein